MLEERMIEVVWDYMLLKNPIETKADCIFALGSFDTRVAERAAELYLAGMAPILIVSGSGLCNSDRPEWAEFGGRTEAEVFADVAIKAGVPAESIIIENKSQNTGQNYEFTGELLKTKGVDVTSGEFSCIAVQKPFMERRTYATGKVWWPNCNLIVTSPQISLADYYRSDTTEGGWIHYMVGDLQRIKIYPEMGFQIPQEIPDFVWLAYEELVKKGYTKCLVKK
jgi:uncharacterized SAM-binding protein YcdF (DUF218 family)